MVSEMLGAILHSVVCCKEGRGQSQVLQTSKYLSRGTVMSKARCNSKYLEVKGEGQTLTCQTRVVDSAVVDP